MKLTCFTIMVALTASQISDCIAKTAVDDCGNIPAFLAGANAAQQEFNNLVQQVCANYTSPDDQSRCYDAAIAIQ